MKSFLGKENPELKLKLLPAELPGIANRCLTAYRRLLRRGRFVQPSSGLALLARVKAQINPWSAFMGTYWDCDPEGEGAGTQCAVFVKVFRHWCMKAPETYEFAGKSKSYIIQEINKLPEWTWLKSFRPAGAMHERQRRYRVKLKPGVQLPDEVLTEDE